MQDFTCLLTYEDACKQTHMRALVRGVREVCIQAYGKAVLNALLTAYFNAYRRALMLASAHARKKVNGHAFLPSCTQACVNVCSGVCFAWSEALFCLNKPGMSIVDWGSFCRPCRAPCPGAIS